MDYVTTMIADIEQQMEDLHKNGVFRSCGDNDFGRNAEYLVNEYVDLYEDRDRLVWY